MGKERARQRRRARSAFRCPTLSRITGAPGRDRARSIRVVSGGRLAPGCPAQGGLLRRPVAFLAARLRRPSSPAVAAPSGGDGPPELVSVLAESRSLTLLEPVAE